MGTKETENPGAEVSLPDDCGERAPARARNPEGFVPRLATQPSLGPPWHLGHSAATAVVDFGTVGENQKQDVQFSSEKCTLMGRATAAVGICTLRPELLGPRSGLGAEEHEGARRGSHGQGPRVGCS